MFLNYYAYFCQILAFYSFLFEYTPLIAPLINNNNQQNWEKNPKGVRVFYRVRAAKTNGVGSLSEFVVDANLASKRK
jgi:hypothetical protein